MDLSEQIVRFLQDKGVKRFWAYSQTDAISNVFQGNKYFVSQGSYPEAVIHEDGYVKEFKMKVTVCYPDSKKVLEGILTYTFDPKQNPAHQAKIHY